MTAARTGWIASLLALILVCCVDTPGSYAGDPPSLAMAPASPPTTSVVVTMRERADLSKVTGRHAARRRKVIAQLKATAQSSQAGLTANLDGWRRASDVTSFTPLWATNSIAVTATPAVVASIAARSDVASVAPDRIQLAPARAPAPSNIEALHTSTVWDAGAIGSGVVVASLDSGVDLLHPDLQDRWRGGANSWFDPYGQHPTTPTDLMGHGTNVTGVMVAGDGSGASLGVAPGASWIAARVFDDSGSATISAVHQAFQWVLDPDNNPATDDAPDVVNASWSIGAGPGCDLTFQPDLAALRAAEIVPIFPAGNFGGGDSSSVSPANYPEALSVGAVADSGLISSSSSRGPSACGDRTRPFPDVVASGVDVLATDLYGLYQTTSGTSVAAPHVAGVLALLLGARPGLTAAEQQKLLLNTAADLGDPGPDETYGNGLVDAAAAYAALPALNPTFALNVTPPSGSVQAGSDATYAVSVAPSDGFANDVDLSVSGLPVSVGAASLAPATVPGGTGVSTLTIATDLAATVGTYDLTLTASGGTTTQTAVVTLEVTAPPPPPPPADALVFSTRGPAVVPGVAGWPDDADVYRWEGASFGRDVDATALWLPATANVDGLDWVDSTHFYVSFEADTKVPGLGRVQDEDVVYYNAGTWTVWFDGTARGLTASGADIDAFNISGSTLRFSTLGAVRVPGVGGFPDDADIYLWDGQTFSRGWDATANGLSHTTNVDGVVATPTGRLYLSFAPTGTLVPGLGLVGDEDVVSTDSNAWSMYFDGSVKGLSTSEKLDIDAFDLP